MNYIAYFFNGLYRFLGGATSVIKILSIFTTAFAIGVLAPVSLPIALATALVVGVVVVGVDAYRQSQKRKKIHVLGDDVDALQAQVDELLKINEQKKHKLNLLNSTYLQLKGYKADLGHEVELLRELHEIYLEKYQSMSPDKVPENAKSLLASIKVELAIIEGFDKSTQDLPANIAQIAKLNQRLIGYLEAHNSPEETSQLLAGVRSLQAKQSSQSGKSEAKLAANEPVKPKKDEPSSFWQKLKPFAQPASVAVKTSLMLFGLCFGIATLSIALFVGPPLAVAAAMPLAVIAFSGVLMAASLAIGTTTAYFNQKYISKETTKLNDLTESQKNLTAKKQSLELSNTHLKKELAARKDDINEINDELTKTLTQVRDKAKKIDHRLMLPNKPQKANFALGQSQDIIDKLKPGHAKEAMSQDEIMRMFEQLSQEQKQTLIEKWRDEGYESIPDIK